MWSIPLRRKAFFSLPVNLSHKNIYNLRVSTGGGSAGSRIGAAVRDGITDGTGSWPRIFPADRGLGPRPQIDVDLGIDERPLGLAVLEESLRVLLNKNSKGRWKKDPRSASNVPVLLVEEESFG